jgi:hypothetical protein
MSPEEEFRRREQAKVKSQKSKGRRRDFILACGKP